MLSLCHRGGSHGVSETQQPTDYMLILVVLSLIKGLSAKGGGEGVELKEQVRFAHQFYRPLCVRGRGKVVRGEQ